MRSHMLPDNLGIQDHSRKRVLLSPSYWMRQEVLKGSLTFSRSWARASERIPHI